MMDLSLAQWLIVMFASFLVGASKAGLKGLGIIVVALLVLVFEAKAQTGILLPILILGDILAVIYYKRHVKWHYLAKFLPAMIVGVMIAGYLGDQLPEEAFKKWLGGVVLVSVVIMLWWDFKGKDNVPNNWLFAGSSGVAAGFATMIGNLAGAFANMFFLATRLPKNEIIGTSAWLFFIINLVKLPIHIFSWETIHIETLKIDLLTIPAILFGFWIGQKIVALINEKYYRYFLLIATSVGAIVILL